MPPNRRHCSVPIYFLHRLPSRAALAGSSRMLHPKLLSGVADWREKIFDDSMLKPGPEKQDCLYTAHDKRQHWSETESDRCRKPTCEELSSHCPTSSSLCLDFLDVSYQKHRKSPVCPLSCDCLLLQFPRIYANLIRLKSMKCQAEPAPGCRQVRSRLQPGGVQRRVEQSWHLPMLVYYFHYICVAVPGLDLDPETGTD